MMPDIRWFWQICTMCGSTVFVRAAVCGDIAAYAREL